MVRFHLSMRSKKIYFECGALVADHFSGVGHYVMGIAKALDDFIGRPEHALLQAQSKTTDETILCVPRNHRARLNKFGFLNTKAKSFPFHSRILHKLVDNKLLPPLDTWFGRGTYLFTNFTRYPLWRAKSATVIYDISFELVPQFVDANNRRFLSKVVRQAVTKSNLIITISKSAKDEIANFYNIPPSKIIVAYPSVDRSLYYKRSPEEIKEIKIKYGLPDNYVLFVGNLEPRKNITTLIDAYTQLPLDVARKFPLLLVGANGWLSETIFEKLKEAEKAGYTIVRPNKYVNDRDLPAIYSGATMLAYPSHYEGFGMPPVEAMACGVPVITADNSSLPEAVGDAGIMVNSTDTKGISKAILQLMNDDSLRQQLTARGYEQVKKFSWDESAQKIYKALVEL